MRRLAALLVLGAITIAGCSDRDRLNPLDPANVLTGGAPQQFVALAGDGTAELRWRPPPTSLVFGFRLSRRVGTATTFTLLAELAPDVDHYIDGGLANDVDCTYRLSYLLQGDVASAPAEATARPGLARPWVADYNSRAVVRLTPDGRYVAERFTGSMQSPAALDVDQTTGQVWVCDPSGRRMWRITPGGGIEEIGSLAKPVAIEVDPVRGRAWICDQGLGALQSFDRTNPVSPRVDIRGLGMPISVGVDPTDGSAWVAERDSARIRHIGLSGNSIGSTHVLAPSRVAVDSATRRVWITSFDQHRVDWFSAAGTPIDSIKTLSGPVGVAVDGRSGRVWVCDSRAHVVIAYDRNGVELMRVTGLEEPIEIGLDRDTGDAWVTLQATAQVVRITPDGHIAARLGGFGYPADIAIHRQN